MKILVGYTGLLGKTLCEHINFDLKFNSKNIESFNNLVSGSDNELYLTCLPATKWMVKKDTEKDINNIFNIFNILKTKNYKKIFLFSTIDVYNDSPIHSDENYHPNISKLNYGNNRRLFELMVKEYLKFDDLKIFRLPSLFSKNIKKNILFDLLTNNNIEQINSNSSYQWYNLDNLYKDIYEYSSKYPEEVEFNLFPEPIETEVLLSFFENSKHKVNYGDKIIYDFKTKFTENGYIMNKEQILKEIKNFINEGISK